MGRWKRFQTRLSQAVQDFEAWLTPERVARRRLWQHALRYQQEVLAQRESADSDRFRGSKWLVSRLSPDSEAEQDLESVRNRAWDLYLNDPTASGFVRGRVTQIVGTGLTFQSRIRTDGQLGITLEDSAALKKSIEAAWKKWSKACDRTGLRSIWQIQRLAQRCLDRDGEVFVVFSDREDPNKAIPLTLEVVPATRVSTPPDQEGRENVRLGIDRDQFGRPVAYFIRTTPPNDTKDPTEKFERIPADRVCHIFELEDGDQSRGWPSMQPVQTSLKDIKDLDEAAVIKRQIEACNAVFIKNLNGSPRDAAIAAASATTSNSDRIEEVLPGMIRYLGPGEEVEGFTPASSGGDHATYMEHEYHKVSAGLEYPYELLRKRYGGTNYSSGRLSLLDGRAVFRCSQKLVIEMLLYRVGVRFIEELVLFGLVDITAVQYLESPDQYGEHAWIPAGWPWVDPIKEVTADEKAVEDRFTSRTRVNGGRGLDDEEIQEELLLEAMRDADNELKLREYRKKIGLDPVPAAADQNNQAGDQTANALAIILAEIEDLKERIP